MTDAMGGCDSAGAGDGPPGEPELVVLKRALVKAASLVEPTERLLEVAAIIGQSLRDLRVEPVVVGGLAVAYWSDAAFLTADIDVVMARPAELDDRLSALGFTKQGREWVLPDYEIAFEIPAESLELGDEAVIVTLPSGRRVRVLSLEDSLLWRLREWVHWQSPAGFRQASFLLVSESLDRSRLEERAAEEGPAATLAELRRVTAEIEQGRHTRVGSSPKSPRPWARPARFDQMAEREIDFRTQMSRRDGAAVRRQRLAAGFATPYRRERLRSESEARFLRRIGTPEDLIGPVGTDDEVADERAALLEFARKRRSSASAG